MELKNEKKVYKSPKVEIIKIKKDEIIVTSGPVSGNSFGTPHDGYKMF